MITWWSTHRFSVCRDGNGSGATGSQELGSKVSGFCLIEITVSVGREHRRGSRMIGFSVSVTLDIKVSNRVYWPETSENSN
jgi:hypothetical protein